MEKPTTIPYGRKVVLKADYPIPFDALDDRRVTRIIRAGNQGIVDEGIYCHGIFIYEKECPVQFGIKDANIPKTIGIPWALIEFI